MWMGLWFHIHNTNKIGVWKSEKNIFTELDKKITQSLIVTEPTFFFFTFSFFFPLIAYAVSRSFIRRKNSHKLRIKFSETIEDKYINRIDLFIQNHKMFCSSRQNDQNKGIYFRQFIWFANSKEKKNICVKEHDQ